MSTKIQTQTNGTDWKVPAKVCLTYFVKLKPFFLSSPFLPSMFILIKYPCSFSPGILFYCLGFFLLYSLFDVIMMSSLSPDHQFSQCLASSGGWCIYKTLGSFLLSTPACTTSICTPMNLLATPFECGSFGVHGLLWKPHCCLANSLYSTGL